MKQKRTFGSFSSSTCTLIECSCQFQVVDLFKLAMTTEERPFKFSMQNRRFEMVINHMDYPLDLPNPPQALSLEFTK